MSVPHRFVVRFCYQMGSQSCISQRVDEKNRDGCSHSCCEGWQGANCLAICLTRHFHPKSFFNDGAMHGLIFSFGPFRLIPSQALLLEGDRPLHLGSRALAILQVLAERAGQVVEKEELARLVWPKTFVDETNIRVHISNLRRALGDGQRGSRYIVNIPGRGYRFAVAVDRSLDTQPSDENIVSTSELPHFITRLIGRDDAAAKLNHELARDRMVTVVGSGGIGKTSLVLAATPSWLADSGYELRFVDLALVSDPATVSTTVASTIFGTKVREDVIAALLHELRIRRLLIILDNCEHVIAAAGSFCETVLAGTHNVRLLATSREALRIPGEHIHRLAALPTPPVSETITAAEALQYPAVQLFVERAIANVDTFEIRDADATAIGNICRRLDGVPLSIEFAAARTDLFDVHSIAQRLDDRFSLLTKGSRNALPRQESLLAVLEWSCGLMSGERKIVLSRLSVFAGHFSVDDAIDVVSGEGISRQTVLESLSDLVDKSILLADASGPAIFYRLLETTQAYSYERLQASGAIDAVHRRHARRFLNVCQAYIARPTDQRELRRILVDVRVALEWSFGRRADIALGVALAAAATPFILELTLLRDYRRYIDLALKSLADNSIASTWDFAPRAEISLRIAQVFAHLFLDKSYAELPYHLERGRRIAIEIGDIPHQLKVLWMEYGIAVNQGRYNHALEWAEIYSEVAAKSDELMADPISHRLLSGALCDLGQYTRAQEHAEKALRIDREAAVGIRFNAYEMDHWVASKSKLVKALWLRGRPDDAKAEAHQCLSEALNVGQEQTTCFALGFHIIPVVIWRGDLDEAASFVSLLLKLSHNVFQHYHDWGQLYRQFLDTVGPVADRDRRLFEVGLNAKVPAQADMLATFDVSLVRPDVLARAEANQSIWVAPEVLRATAHRLVIGANNVASTAAETTLLRSLDLAQSGGAKGWELRIATSLALLYERLDRRLEARDVLENTLNEFTQGHDTRDVRTALQLLSSLR